MVFIMVPVNTIIRVAEKKERINKLLEENSSDYRISEIRVENAIPPKVVFSVTQEGG